MKYIAIDIFAMYKRKKDECCFFFFLPIGTLLVPLGWLAPKTLMDSYGTFHNQTSAIDLLDFLDTGRSNW